MKFICIYKPIDHDPSLPIAIHPTSETRGFRQKWIFEKFRSQFNIDPKLYFIDFHKNTKNAHPIRYNVKKRWCTVVRKLAIKHGYFVKGRYNIWCLYSDPIPFEIYILYPLAFPTLVKIVESIVIGERNGYMYDVIARYLHDMEFPIPNMESRTLYMKTLFGDLNRVANRVAELSLKNATNGVPENFFRYLEIKHHFWNSQAVVNIICAKMSDLNGSKQYVRAVLPSNRNILLSTRKVEKVEIFDPSAA